jgi:hypothetical protein
VYEIATNRDSDTNLSMIFDTPEHLTLEVFPEGDLAGQVHIVLGSSVNYYFRLGVVLDPTWTFSGSPERCTCPYLFGGTVSSLSAYWKRPDLYMFRSHVLRALDDRVPLFTDWRRAQQCIFASEKLQEGISWLRFDAIVPSYVISRFDFSTGPNLGAAHFRPVLRVLGASGGICQDLQLPAIKWDLSVHHQHCHEDRRMVVIHPVEDSVRWQGRTPRGSGASRR